MSQNKTLVECIFLYQTVLFVSILVFLSSCSNEEPASNLTLKLPLELKSTPKTVPDDWALIDLPDISKQPITLRVTNVVNPRFKQLSDQQVQSILKRSQDLVKQHFNVSINFSSVHTQTIDEVFKTLKPNVVDKRKKEIVNIRLISDEDREAMQLSVFNTLANYTNDKQGVLDYAQPHLLHPEIKQTDFIGLSYALVDTLIARLNYWQQQKADDGNSVLDDNGYHEWVWWDSLGYGDLPYDIVITNQLVASAEYYGMDVHSSIRGGLTAGTTTYNHNALLSSYVYIMVYPMLNDTELLTTLRQDESYSDDQIVDYSAALLAHELGHMLLHLGHPFGNKSCIMAPTSMLHYREWYDALDASKCALGSNEGMIPGAAKIEYNRNW